MYNLIELGPQIFSVEKIVINVFFSTFENRSQKIWWNIVKSYSFYANLR